MALLRHACWLLLLIAMLPFPVAAQAVSADAERAALEHPALISERATLSATMASARAGGLPTELLVAKLREGVAKRVPPARIAHAVTLLHQRLQSADRLLRGVPSAPTNDRRNALYALVDALNAGLTEGDLMRVIAALGASGREPRVVVEVAVTMAELAERGFAGDSVVRAIALAWDRGGVRAMPSVIVAAAGLGPQVASRDAALQAAVEQNVTASHAAPGMSGAPGQHGSSAAREPGPPHDDAFEKGQNRGRGNGNGPKP